MHLIIHCPFPLSDHVTWLTFDHNDIIDGPNSSSWQDIQASPRAKCNAIILASALEIDAGLIEMITAYSLAADINPSCIFPEWIGVPVVDQQLHVLKHTDTALIRCNEQLGYSCEASNLEFYLQKIQPQQTVYETELNASPAALLEYLAQNLDENKSTLNLQTKIFYQQRFAYLTQPLWGLGALALLTAVFLNMS